MPARRLAPLVLGLFSLSACTSAPSQSDAANPPQPTVDPLPSAPTPPEPVKLVIDTDGAPDDLVAIAFLVASPSVEIAAITLTGAGEVRCEPGLRIILGLLDRLDAPEIPVACGPEAPTAGDKAFPAGFRENAERAAGLDLPDSTREPVGEAVTLLADVFAEDSGIRLLALGPLTNVATALDLDPSLAARIDSIWIMGGAVDVPGNVAGSPGVESDNTAAEWNIYVDPAALATVLAAGAPVRLISLDGTNQVPVRPEFASRVIAARGASSALDVMAELFAKNDYMTSGDYYLWDALAAIFAVGHEPGTFTDARIEVDTGEGPTSGATRRVEGAPNASYLTQVDPEAAEAILLGTLAGR
jgi:pyrimidine-specific ribonucleoside hydrolase